MKGSNKRSIILRPVIDSSTYEQVLALAGVKKRKGLEPALQKILKMVVAPSTSKIESKESRNSIKDNEGGTAD